MSRRALPARGVSDVPAIASRILRVRDQKVIIDVDLAALYGVETRALNQAVKRNVERFPPDFLFRLTPAEKREVITDCDRLASLRFSKSLPYAFTEHGALMAASVLNAPRAVEASVYVVRAFVQLRELLAGHKELARRLEALEQRVEQKLAGHDEAIGELIAALRHMVAAPGPRKRPIGFVRPEAEEGKDAKEEPPAGSS